MALARLNALLHRRLIYPNYLKRYIYRTLYLKNNCEDAFEKRIDSSLKKKYASKSDAKQALKIDIFEVQKYISSSIFLSRKANKPLEKSPCLSRKVHFPILILQIWPKRIMGKKNTSKMESSAGVSNGLGCYSQRKAGATQCLSWSSGT